MVWILIVLSGRSELKVGIWKKRDRYTGSNGNCPEEMYIFFEVDDPNPNPSIITCLNMYLHMEALFLQGSVSGGASLPAAL